MNMKEKKNENTQVINWGLLSFFKVFGLKKE